MTMEPVTMEAPLLNTPKGGVYLFSEGASYL